MTEGTTSTPKKDPVSRVYSAWMGFAQREIRPGRGMRIRILWGRVAIFLVIMGLLGWFLKSWGLYLFFRNVREFEDVSFSDMVLFPLNRTNLRIQQGSYQIDQAKQAVEREDYRRAFMLLREGVARSPQNEEGRMLLAQFYAGWRPDLAIDLLIDGIERGLRNSDYLRLTSNLLLSQKEDEKILELTDQLLQEDLPEDVRKILAVSRLQAAIFNGRFDTAREVFESEGMDKTLDGLILGTDIYRRIGHPMEAIEVLQSALASLPADRATLVYNRLVEVYKSQEMYNQAREIALKQMIDLPLQFQPRVLLIDALSNSGMDARRDKEIESMLQEFRNEEQAMVTLAGLASNYGNVQAASRLYEIALENGFSLGVFSMALAESLVQDGQYEAAIELCNELIREDPAWMLQAEGSFNALRSLAYFGFDEEELGNLYLKNFLESKQSNVNQMVSTANLFIGLDREEQALRVLQEAYERDPRNETVLANLVEVEMAMGVFFSLDQHLKDLFTLRRPDYRMIEGIRDQLRSDRFLFTRDRVELLDGLSDILSEMETISDWEIWKKVQKTES
jgi:tetratricopeptide (TPR) repeat protein